MRVHTVLIGLSLTVMAAFAGVYLAIWVFQHFKIYIPLQDQKVNIDLLEPLQAEVKIHDALNVDVTGRVSTVIPIKETLAVPIQQTLTPRVYFDNHVPIKTIIPVKETIRLNQEMPVDTRVKVKILGKELSLPLRGTIPIRLDIPLDLNVPLEQNVHLKFDAPVEAVLKQNLSIPVDTKIQANIPIQGHLNVPIKTALKASVDVKNTLPITIQKGDLVIPLNTVRLQRHHIDDASTVQ